jgi:hypothetical protein
MQSGRSLIELATELERQLNSRRDYLADTSAIQMETMHYPQPNPGESRGTPVLSGLIGSPKSLTEHAHGQLASYLDIPKKYYDRMRAEQPELLSENVNTWFKSNPSKRMVRTLDGRVRAILSERYRPLDNYDLASAVLPVLTDLGTQVVSSELTDKRMYLKATLPSLSFTVEGSKMADTRGVAVGDVVQAGIAISNSEVGAGSIKIEPLLFRLVCKNGMIAADSSLRKYHVGRGFEGGDAVAELFTDETRRQDDKAFWLKVIDVVRGAFNVDLFRNLVDRMSEAAHMKIERDNPAEVVELTAKKFALPDGLHGGILKHLIDGGDLSKWGVINAVTATANTQPDYETATELERVGGKILELSQEDWKALAA